MKNQQKIKKPTAVGFYWRKLVLFGGFFAVGIFTLTQINAYRADISVYAPAAFATDLKVDMNIHEDGSVYLDGQKYKERVNITPDGEETRFPLLDNSGLDYNSVQITVTLPKPVASTSKYELLGVHGVGAMSSKVTNANTIVFKAYDVAETAILTPIVIMPSGTITPPIATQVYTQTSKVKAGIWVLIAILLPLITLLYIIALISYQIRRQRIDQPEKESTAPPMAIPPALVGVLFHQKVGAREIAATLIDLAIRGDINIIDRERDFAFIKSKYDRRLLTYEKVLLSKIFKTNLVSDKEEVERRINNHLYSKKLSLVTSGVYILATRLGYFKVNPQKIHLKYLAIGIGGFFVGLAGFGLSLNIFTETPYVAFFWLGMMAASLVIMLTARNIPLRTILGQEAMSNWLAFKKYLSKGEKVAFSYDNQEKFQKYLPYAIAMDCEVAWAKRFSEQNFALPDWFVTDQGGMGLDDFCLALFPIVSYVARSFAAIREPGFKY